MTEQEWSTSTDPAAMLAVICGDWVSDPWPGVPTRKASDRKLRLFAIACLEPAAFGSAIPCAIYTATQIEVLADNSLRICVDHMARCCQELHRQQANACKANILRDIFGNPWKPVQVGAFGGLMAVSWALHPTVLTLARAAYEERTTVGHLDLARLAVLADALEEAGCREEALLRHLRSQEPCPGCSFGETPYYGGGGGWCAFCDQAGPDIHWLENLDTRHVRGCWALDLILGHN